TGSFGGLQVCSHANRSGRRVLSRVDFSQRLAEPLPPAEAAPQGLAWTYRSSRCRRLPGAEVVGKDRSVADGGGPDDALRASVVVRLEKFELGDTYARSLPTRLLQLLDK